MNVRAARNETDGQECARRTVAVARDKCAPPGPRARTTRIIIYNIILLWKKITLRDVRRPRSRRSESEPVVPLADRSINQPPRRAAAAAVRGARLARARRPRLLFCLRARLIFY